MRESIKDFMTVLCYIQFAIMLVFLYANYSIQNETKALRTKVVEMKNKVEASKAECNRLQMEKAAIFQNLVLYKCK